MAPSQSPPAAHAVSALRRTWPRRRSRCCPGRRSPAPCATRCRSTPTAASTPPTSPPRPRTPGRCRPRHWAGSSTGGCAPSTRRAPTSDWSESDVDLGPDRCTRPAHPGRRRAGAARRAPAARLAGRAGRDRLHRRGRHRPRLRRRHPYTTTTRPPWWCPTPLEAGDYWWRVTASLGGGTVSLPSESRVLHGAAAGRAGPGEPRRTAPTPRSRTSCWTGTRCPGAAYYDLRVARDARLQHADRDRGPDVYGTSYSPDDHLQQRAVLLAGPRGRHGRQAHRVAHRAEQLRAALARPARSRSTRPATVASPTHIGGVPYFQWTPVQHASHYQLEVGADPNFSPTTYDTCLMAGTTLHRRATCRRPERLHRTNEDCRMQDGAVFYWRVRPMDAPSGARRRRGSTPPTQAAIWHARLPGQPVPGRGRHRGHPHLRLGRRSAGSRSTASRSSNGTATRWRQRRHLHQRPTPRSTSHRRLEPGDDLHLVVSAPSRRTTTFSVIYGAVLPGQRRRCPPPARPDDPALRAEHRRRPR